MPKANALVSLIEAAPTEDVKGGAYLGSPVVALPSGPVEFDPDLPQEVRIAKQELIARLHAQRLPGYFLFNDQGQLKEVSAPAIGQVVSLTPADAAGWSVTLSESAERFVIDRKSDPENFAVLEANAKLGVAIRRDRHGLYVHALPSGFTTTIPRYEEVTVGRDILNSTTELDSEDEANEIFNEMFSDHKCRLSSLKPGCIPFLYPKDGCEARAHRMGEILRAQSITVAKAWQFGQLVFQTRNAPCRVALWGAHVAVFLRIRVNGKSDIRVLDPSMFNGPVTHFDWYSAMGGSSRSVFSAREIFKIDPASQRHGRAEDPDCRGTGVRETDRDLAKYAALLAADPPPFESCA